MPAQDEPLLHVVLVRPEIPSNTGSIGRTCVATHCALHLVRPLGFDTDEKALRRAGMDYWRDVDVRDHEDFDAYRRAHPTERRWLTSGLPGIGRTHWDAGFEVGDHVLFGAESCGLPEDLLRAHEDRVLRLPMAPSVRGLNIASCATTLVYEALRQLAQRDPALVDERAVLRGGR